MGKGKKEGENGKKRREGRTKRHGKFKKHSVRSFTAGVLMWLLLGGISQLPKDRNVDTNTIFRIIQMELILTGASVLKVHGRPLAQLCWSNYSSDL